MPAYLDHAATTALRQVAREAMEPWLGDLFGNPSGGHAIARRARRAVDDARDQVAAALGCLPREVVFTGGGTEADNLAIFGAHRSNGGAVVCSATEHHAVLDPTIACGGTTVPVDRNGSIDLDGLAAAVTDATAIVSVMLANNEVGTIQPLEAVVEVVKAINPDTLVHTDAVQAVCWLDVATATRTVDLVSISAHKFGGPQGVGALVVRDGAHLAPLLLGGGQEHERRSGTHNVAGIVGAGAAITETARTRVDEVARISGLRDRLLDGLVDVISGAVETGGPDRRDQRIAGVAHVCLPDIESEALLFMLEDAGVHASAASSCASGAQQTSHVLAAMGVDHELAAGSLRLSLGHTSTAADVDEALAAVPAAVERLRVFA